MATTPKKEEVVTGSALSGTGSFAPGASQSNVPSPIVPTGIAPVIKADNLYTPVTPINLAAGGATGTNNADGSSTGILGSVADQAKNAATATATPYTDSAKTIIDEITALQGQDNNKTADTQTAENAAGVGTANTALKGITDQINNLSAEYASSGLQIDSSNQGKGVVSAIGDRQKAEANRQFAIRGLTLGAQLSGAQGNLQLAKDQAQRVIDLKYNPIESKISQKLQQIQLITPFLNAEQTAIADKRKEELEDKRTALSDNKALLRNVISSAQSNGQSDVAGAALALDPSSDSFIKDLAGLQKQLKDPLQDLDIQLKRAQLAKLRTDNSAGTAPTIKTINGVDYQWNGKEWVVPKVNGATDQNITLRQDLQDKITNIGDLINHKGLNGSVGPNVFARSSPDFDFFTGVRGDFIAGVQQLVSQDTLQTLLNLKKAGGTLGALSEGEGKMLRSAATKIGTWEIKDDKGNVTGYKTTDASMKKELQTIQDLTQRALTAAGGKTYTPEESAKNYLESTLNVLANPDPYASYLSPSSTAPTLKK